VYVTLSRYPTEIYPIHRWTSTTLLSARLCADRPASGCPGAVRGNAARVGTALGMEGSWLPNGRSSARAWGVACEWVQCPVEERVGSTATRPVRRLDPHLASNNPPGRGM